MKILKNIITIILWSVLALYITLITAMRFDAVQAYIGSHTAEMLSKKLGTRVEVGEVDLAFLNRAIIDNVVLYDQKGKKMLKAARLSAKINIPALANGKIEISSAQIFSAHFNLYRQNSATPHNFQFVLDSLASKDNSKKSELDLRINSLIIRHSSVSYNQWDKIKTPNKLNPNHLAVSDLSGHIILKCLTNDSINLNIKKLSLKEQSGLSLNRMSLAFEAGKQNATLKDFCLKLPDTKIEIDEAAATYKTYDGFKVKEGSMKYAVTLKPSRITPSDIACIVPALRYFDSTAHIDAKAHGTDRTSVIDFLNLTTANNEIDIRTAARVTLKKNIKPETTLYINKIEAKPESYDFIAKNVFGNDSIIPAAVRKLGNVKVSGQLYSGMDTKVRTNMNVKTDAGNIDINGRWTNSGNIAGAVNIDEFDLGSVLSNEKLGTVASKINISGNIDNSKLAKANIKGIVSNITYNNHTFKDIQLEALYDNKALSYNMNINNHDIELYMDGSIIKENKDRHLTLSARIENILPQKINLTDKYGNAAFSGDVTADFTGTNINNVCGIFEVSNFKMVSETDFYRLEKLQITSGFNEKKHYLNLDSDFGTILLSGYYNYTSLPQSFVNVLKKHIPTMPGLPSYKTKADNKFDIDMRIVKSDWLKKLFAVDLELQQPLELTGSVNDIADELNIELSGNALEYNGTPYSNVHLDINSDNSALVTNAAFTQKPYNKHNMVCSLNAVANNNHVTTNLSWDNTGNDNKGMSGNIKAVSQFYTGDNGQRTADIDIEPSHININGARWDVTPANIKYYKNHINVRYFSINHGEQHLTINGTGSKSANDSLTIDLKDVDVEYVLDLVNFHSVDFNGLASGKAVVTSPFSTLEANANLKVKNFEFEHGRMGTLNATAAWNNEDKQIDIHGICNDGPDAMTFVNGYVSPQRNYIDLDISANGTYIEFMQSFTKSFAKDLTGRVNGKVKLSGPLSTINLTGQLVVDGEATIKSLNCKYYLVKDTVRLIPDEIELRNARISDIYNNVGYINGFIHHKHLTRLSYDLDVTADNLLAYDFKEFDGSTFCGTVYATGDVGIHGKSGELRIDVNCTPQKNSVFSYNASSPDAITNQEFIRWNDVTPDSTANISATVESKPEEKKEDDYIDTGSDIYINFLVNCRPDASLRLLMDSQTKDYITLNGSGVLRASYYNKGSFNMFGTYTIDHGTYGLTIQNIIKKNFQFNQGGTIIFGGDPYDAAINLQAVYTVNGVSLSDLSAGNAFIQKNTTRVNCLMNIGGQPKNPQVTFDLDMPTMEVDEKQMVMSLMNTEEEKNQQVLYLLAIGRFYPQVENNSGAGQTSQTSLAMQSILSGTISGQINSLLSNVVKSDNWNFGANISTGDEGWNNAEYEGLINGRMLNNRLMFNGEFGYRDNAKTANTSFIGDFDIQYNLVPSGNFAIKVYNETNDRYFTKSSLNTQGVGLIMKRDFTNWRDFWGIGNNNRNKKKRSKASKKSNKN